jgi:eukaryotic-like serine/threonine-protein kinase
MSLASGTRLGPYQIAAPLGAGGMGEVYRASDTRSKREVALKVLPELFAGDAQRLARFEREAQVLASLNHPHIAHIHGLEESNGTRELVMELVEGPTLAERIAQGSIPLEEALSIAKQIAEALEYAHEKGIIHRDLKPANIKLTPDGQVKVLDFGLAKALEGDCGDTNLSTSPTIRAAATRADIWAFGVLLFEMLTARGLYEGETTSEILARVIERQPDLTHCPLTLPLRFVIC